LGRRYGEKAGKSSDRARAREVLRLRISIRNADGNTVLRMTQVTGTDVGKIGIVERGDEIAV
jgi:hypothetical protein